MGRLLGASLMCAAGLILPAQGASAQPAHAAHSMSALRELNRSVEALVRRVSPSVVQVVVMGYGPRGGVDGDSLFDIVRQVTVGSGVTLDPDGYIVTNAHVVAGAVRVQVVLSASSADDTPASVLGGATKTFDARIVGVVKDIDLAVLKINTANLIALTIGDYDTVRKGDIVFALGSPGGLWDDTLHLELKPIDMLGILAVEIDDVIGLLLPSLRIPSGLIVAARTEHWRGPSLSIAAGDVIHAINGTAIRSVGELVSALTALEARQPIVLQVERDGKLTFIAFELD